VATMALLLALLGVPLSMLRRGRRPLDPLYRLAVRRGTTRWRTWLVSLRHAEAQVMVFFRDHPGAFLEGVLGSLVIEALLIGEYHFLLVAFGLVVDLPMLLMTLLASGLVRTVPTPAGLGALEAGQVTVFAAATGQASVGFVVGIVLRLHETFWIALGFGALAFRRVSLARGRTAPFPGQPAS